MAGTLGVGKLAVLSPRESLNLRISLVKRPWRNLTVSGPRNRMTERDFMREATGPEVWSLVW